MLNDKNVQINCIGCGLCASQYNLDFSLNDDGYYRPFFPQNFDYKELEKICPIYYKKNETPTSVWGNYHSVYKAFSNDPIINNRASSGGVISSFLIWLLENSIIDAVIHVGVSKSNPLMNEVFISETPNDILHCAGSRYAPASPLLTLKDCLKNNKRYAFVGKPCDCRAIRKYLEVNPSEKEKFVVIISFFCAGTPSIKATETLIKAVGGELGSVQSVSYRGNGWPGFATVVDNNGSHEMEYEKSWGGILGRTKQQFCRICIEGTGNAADISCGDAWNLTSDKKPDFSDSEGRNIVFTRTKIGQELFDQCVNDKIVTRENYDIAELKHVQPYQFERVTTALAQVYALRISSKYTPNYSLKNLYKLSKENSVKANVRIFIGTIKRVIRKQIR